MLPLALTPDLISCLVALGVFLVVYILWVRSPDPRLPPCPTAPLPILGHVLSLEKNPRVQFMEWSKKCGDIFSLYIGTSLVVVVNGYDAMKELLVKRADLTSDRPVIVHDLVIDTVDKGVLFSSGSNWKEQRSTIISILRAFGMGKDRLAGKIQEEVDCYISRVTVLLSKGENTLDIRGITNEAVSNVICSIITGQRFGYDDETFKDLIDKLNAGTSVTQAISLVHLFPSLRFLPGDLFHAKKIEFYMTTIKELFARKWIKTKGCDEYDENNIDNLIAAYLFECKKKTKAGHTTFLDDSNLEKNIMDLFAAGSETTSTTIAWCLLYTLHHPDVQEKIYQEIHREVGTERRPNMGDKTRLVYLEAVTRETQRLANLVPLSLPHVVREDFEYKGYKFPKGTQLFPNLGSVLYDKSVWGEDAEKFRPERFFDSTGHLVNPPEFIPFSIGRRVCLGESLAKMQLFLFLSAIFQRFKLSAVNPNDLPSLKPNIGFTSTPYPFEVKIVDRLAN